MGLCVRWVRGLALCCLVLGGVLVGGGLLAVASSDVAVAQTSQSIVVQGNRRVEASTIRSYFKRGPGGRIGAAAENEAIKALYATGLFSDVRVSHAGGRLVVSVVENPVINQVAFEGNRKAKDAQLQAEVQSKARGTLSRPTVQADVQRIIEIYHRTGRFDVTVVPKIIELPNNRVNLVFEINEGAKTGVKEIRFVALCRRSANTIRLGKASSSSSRSTRVRNTASAPSTLFRMCMRSIPLHCAMRSSLAAAMSSMLIWCRKASRR
jgi:outer membrane protein insertion porin family